jgi:hypothetical protein
MRGKKTLYHTPEPYSTSKVLAWSCAAQHVLAAVFAYTNPEYPYINVTAEVHP